MRGSTRQPADRPRFEQRRALDNALLGWIGVAVAVSVTSFCVLIATQDPGAGGSVVAMWVAGVAMTLVLGPCALFAVLAHRDTRGWWLPLGIIAISALVGLDLIVRLN